MKKEIKTLFAVATALMLATTTVIGCGRVSSSVETSPDTSAEFLVEDSTVASVETSTEETKVSVETKESVSSSAKHETTAAQTTAASKPTEKQTEKPTVKPTEKQTETQKATEKQTEKPTERPTEKPTEKQTETQKQTEHQHTWEVLERTEIIPAKYETRLVQVGTEKVQVGTKTVVDFPERTYMEQVKVGEEYVCVGCGSNDDGIEHALSCGGSFTLAPIYDEKEVVIPAVTHEEPIYEEKPVMKEERVLVEPEQRKKVAVGHICSGCGAIK